MKEHGKESRAFLRAPAKVTNMAARSAAFLTASIIPATALAAGKDTADLWVHGFWSWDWANSYERVASLDLDQHLIKTAPSYGLYGFRAGQRFCWLNILEELDQPGEWFLDRKRGVLYFWPPAPLESGETLLSILDEPLIKVTDARHITIQGVTLEATRASGVEITGGANNRIVGCLVHMSLGEPDAQGRRKPVAVSGSEFFIPADVILIAYGFDAEPAPKFAKDALIIDRWGPLNVDGHQMTSVPGVFAGGDSSRGASLVVHAVRDGRIAARGIDLYLQNHSPRRKGNKMPNYQLQNH